MVRSFLLPGMATSLLLASTFCAAPIAQAQDAPSAASAGAWAATGMATTDRTEVYNFKSALNGNSYKVFVSLPAGYEKDQSKYPALYLLDGNQSWLYGRSAVDRIGDDMPPLVLVAVGYEGKSERWTDYGSPAKSFWEIPEDRGAPLFMRVLKEEIIPFVERTYRVDPADRGIGGHSMGGFFSMWALFNTPETFQRYWISSPTVRWDNFVLRDLADKFSQTHPGMKGRVYSDIGSLEDRSLSDELAGLRSRAIFGTSLDWVNRVAPGLPHSGVPAAEIVPALYHLYGRPVVPASAKRRRELAGTYELPDKTRFTLTTDGTELFFGQWESKTFPIIPAPERVPVLSETPETFYIRMVGFEFRTAAGQHGKVKELTLARRFFGEPTPIGTAVRVGP